MPIATSCACGRALRLKDELAGKRVRCPQCRAVLQVPEENVESDFEVVHNEPPAPSSSQQFLSQAPRRATPDEAPPPPPKRKRRRRRVEDRGGGWHFPISISPGVIGGFLCMVIAVVWFIVGCISAGCSFIRRSYLSSGWCDLSRRSWDKRKIERPESECQRCVASFAAFSPAAPVETPIFRPRAAGACPPEVRC